VHVGNLRRKLGKLTSKQRIDTVRGVGFCLRHTAKEGGEGVPSRSASRQ
jgi:DNA-binding winged helix-turn-helix (wHTH) protein